MLHHPVQHHILINPTRRQYVQGSRDSSGSEAGSVDQHLHRNIVDKKVDAEVVKTVIKDSSTDLLEEINIFDVYTGDQIDLDKKSLAFSLRFRSLDATLKDDQIDGIIDRLRQSLREKTGCEFR